MGARRAKGVKSRAMQMPRYFTKDAQDVYASRDWVNGTSVFGAFGQENTEYPADWSELAKGTVSSKYFYGEKGTPQRETSLKDVVGRVSGTMGRWSGEQKYFSQRDAKIFESELAEIVLDQRAAFNSPVWFNVGVDQRNPKVSRSKKSSYIINDRGKVVSMPRGKEYVHPQTAACFIQGVEDTMEDIMRLTYDEAMLFKYGSGTGTDLSTLRSSLEKLSGGGIPSGPLAYLKYMSRVAGIVRSGGKTRRAAKMDSLHTDHPEIMEFIECKTHEKGKAEALMAQGYSAEEAIETVAYQNVNLSIRASDDFMNAVLEGGDWQTKPVHNKDMIDEMPVYKAKDLIGKISEGTRVCGDPGMQFHDTINKWHTCPNSGPINASNPCSEYMFINDSACNLASIRLTKFLDDDGNFDVEAFGNVSRTIAFAQDALIDKSSYPTKTIAKNAHKFRPLGQGYADLGAMLMSLGLPYDSVEGRAVAASVTALQTAKVYEASTEMAEKMGAFEGFEENREPMLNVMNMHRSALDNIDRSKLPAGLENVLDAAYSAWNNVVDRGEKFGFRNAQATVLAPTGTIGFMMDCDTTGIEPDFALRKTKKLFDGGTVNIVNRGVKSALENLDYSSEVADEIVKYVEEHGSMDGAPHLRDEHLPVFDCAAAAGDGRYISPMAHLDMMEAVQPFLSGAISKTVNLPKDVSKEEIESLYIAAWQKGVKAVALYVDGSHVLQPLSNGDGKGKTGGLEEIADEQVATRRRLPNERQSVTHKFEVAGHEGYLTVGMYDSGEPGELFINMNKEGSTIGGLMDTIGVLTSMALQYGVPLESLTSKFKNQKFAPNGIVWGHDKIKTATSIVDYIGKYLEGKFVQDRAEVSAQTIENGNGPIDSDDSSDDFDWDNIPMEEQGGFCPNDGKVMRKMGHCREVCQCGHVNTNGCGE